MTAYKYLASLMLLMLYFGYTNAKPVSNTLTGMVTDSRNIPVADAIITIPDLKTGAATDSLGRYSITNLPKGKYLVQVHMLSYATITAYVEINGATIKDFVLEESILEKSEVVITGSSIATEQKRNTTPILSVGIRELQENASTNIVDALAKLPGINQVATGPAIGKPVIRGLGYNRIITMNNGIRQEGQQWGDEHGIEIDDYNVSKVEILKGPASLAYGSDALAGVINIISEESVPAGKISGKVITNYQTNNGLAALHAQIVGNTKGLTWNGFATGKTAHDYKNKYDGHVFNTRYNNLNYGASLGINRQLGFSKISFTSFNQHLGLAEGARDSSGKFLKWVNNNGSEEGVTMSDEDGTSYQRQLPRQEINHLKLAWENSLYLKNAGRLGLNLGYQQNTRKEFEDVLEPGTPGLKFLLKTYSYDLKYILHKIYDWNISVGVNGMYQTNENKAEEFLIPEYSLLDAGAYVIAKKDWEQVSVSGGLRMNYRQVKTNALHFDSTGVKVEVPAPNGFTQFTAFEKTFTNLAGSIGMSYLIRKRAVLKLNFASGYRAPNIAELSANGVHEGTIRYEYGSPDIKAENSLQADLGFEWSSDHIHFNAAVFYNYLSHFIFIRKLPGMNSSDSIPAQNNEEGFPAFIYDQGNASLYGGEMYCDLHPHPLDWLHLENTFSYVRGTLNNKTDSTQNLPGIPPAKWTVELKAQKKTISSFLKNAYLKTGLDINFKQDHIFSAYHTETTSPGYTLWNAGMGADITNKKQKAICTVTVSAQNILDIAYQNHLNRLRYADENPTTGRTGIFNTGRNISLLLSFPLSVK